MPSPDTARILHALLDLHERRLLRRKGEAEPSPAAPARRRRVRLRLSDLDLPGYLDQTDPGPRLSCNAQLQHCARAGWIALAWQPLAEGQLLDWVELIPGGEAALYALLGRVPEQSRRGDLAETLLGQRFRFPEGGWRRLAIDDVLAQLDRGRSPAPFDARDLEQADDLLLALKALDGLEGETPYRVFSVQTYSDSKRFEQLSGGLTTLARRARPEWRGWTGAEVLRELGLVPNPSFLILRGNWQLVDEDGRLLELGGFDPAVGVPARQVERLARVRVAARRVICVENLTSFHSLASHTAEGETAAICLAGNPGPAMRRLLRLLDRDRPEAQTILAWNDIDYGGLNILSQLRQRVSPDIPAWRMDIATLEAFARWARPLTAGDRSGLLRLKGRPELIDQHALIDHMLDRGIKLEQEAIELSRMSS